MNCRLSLLARADGVVYLRHPDSVERAGEKLPAGLEWHDIVSRGGGSYRSGGVFDKEPRWVAVQLLEKYPLVVNVAIAEDVALAGWRSRAIAITLVSTAMGLFLGVAKAATPSRRSWPGKCTRRRAYTKRRA